MGIESDLDLFKIPAEHGESLGIARWNRLNAL